MGMVPRFEPLGSGAEKPQNEQLIAFYTPQACCGVVRNDCCDVSAPRGAVFKLSPKPSPSPKLAIACTS